jgi:hypothetical protein
MGYQYYNLLPVRILKKNEEEGFFLALFVDKLNVHY